MAPTVPTAQGRGPGGREHPPAATGIAPRSPRHRLGTGMGQWSRLGGDWCGGPADSRGWEHPRRGSRALGGGQGSGWTHRGLAVPATVTRDKLVPPQPRAGLGCGGLPVVAGAGVRHLQPVPRAAGTSPVGIVLRNIRDVTASALSIVPQSHPRVGSPLPTPGAVFPPPMVGHTATCVAPSPHPPVSPSPAPAWLRSGSHLAISYVATLFFLFFFSQQKTPLILGWLKGFFFQQAFRCFFFFFLFSAFLSCRGKMKQFSLLGSCFLLQLGPAPQRGGRERGPEMLLPHCRVFGASSKQGGQYPGVPGCMCSEGDSLMSSKCCANVLPWVFLPPSNFACRRGPYARGDRPYAQADPPPNQAGGTPLAPGGLQGIPPPPPRQLGPGSPPSGFIGNGTARKRPALLPG